ncbi:ABC transporter substrate-binding protein [Yinghuangia sp. ASG 101]|uniref:ABC transporter substrate-binding protein n=1 Tax=Yinghuangia sp. ASG 101 TaxID=2896848 RepID=UPI001E435E46|nr:ABC transporter substrate-binding protein [Yinghuangia sp. ASG 101]UGQ11402.1 ABC transporter substrate-binding protein [Yinghuangia sp. ASG 101]
MIPPKSVRAVSGRRRSAAAVAVAMTMALSLAACGSGDDGSDAKADAPGAAAGADASAGTFPTTVKTRHGDVTIKSEPKRVVALGATTADELISLGVTPVKVAGPAEDAAYPWVADKIHDLAAPDMMNASFELNVEAIANAKPDLIVGQGFEAADKAVYDQLSSIAPTVVPDSTSLNVSWDQRLRTTGAAVGRTAEAETLITSLKDEFAAMAGKYPGIKDKTYQLVRADSGGYAFGNGSLFELFGLKPAANQDNTMKSAPLSFENTDQLNADLLVVWPMGSDMQNKVKNDTAFQALPSVRNGTSYVADLAFATAVNSPTPTAMRWVKDKLDPVLAQLST